MAGKSKQKVLSAALLVFLLTGEASTAANRIAVIKSRTFAPFDTAVKRTVQKLEEEKIKAELLYLDLQGDEKTGPEIIRQVRAFSPDLVLTVGTLATRIAGLGIRDIPVVFTMVLNPTVTGGNITGVSLDVPLEEQFANFRLVVPQARKIGVIYSSKESGTIVSQAKTAAAQQGLTLLPIPVDSPAEVPGKLELLKKTDGLWLTADSVVLTPRNVEFILLFTLKEKIPCMGISEEFVKAGTLLGKSLDLESIYSQTARQIKKILNGENPARVPIAAPEKIALVLNLKTAKSIDLSIPPSTVRKAKVIFE